MFNMQSGKCNMASKALNRPKQIRAPTEKGFLRFPQKKILSPRQWKICTSKENPN